MSTKALFCQNCAIAHNEFGLLHTHYTITCSTVGWSIASHHGVSYYSITLVFRMFEYGYTSSTYRMHVMELCDLIALCTYVHCRLKLIRCSD